MATIQNYDNDTIIVGSSLNDSIRNEASNVTIISGNGDDTIRMFWYNSGSNVSVDSGIGNDKIFNYKSNGVTINGNDGDDYIENFGGNIIINGGNGNDRIYDFNGYGDNVTINGGNGDDRIDFSSNNSSAYGGSGNDTIWNFGGNHAVIDGGDGDDDIYNDSSYSTIYAGVGNDTVENQWQNINLVIGSYTSTYSGDDIFLETKNGSVLIKDVKNKTLNIIPVEDPEPEPDTDNASVFASLDTDTSVQLLKDLNKLGEDIPVEENGNYSNEIVKELMSSSNGIIRFITTVFEESTKNDPSAETANIGFAVINDLNSVLNSIFNIASGEVTGADLVTEIGSIGDDVADLAEQIYDLVKTDSDTELIPPIASYVVGLTTNVVAVVADGASKDEVAGIIENATELLAETINLLSESPTLKTWFENKTAGKILTGMAGKASLIVTLGLGLYAGFEQYIESTEKYQLDGVLASTATKDKWVDTIGTTLHSLTNSVTGGLDDFVFEQVHGAVAVSVANISYGLQYLAALISGGDTSNIEYKVNTTGGKNCIEILGDAFKAIFFQQITGTTNGDKIVNSTEKIIMSGAGDDDIYNYNSNVEIYAGDGVDTVFCNEDSYGNYIDGGADNDKITFYGTSNIIHGSAGNDMIVAFSNYKTPTSGNQIFGESGNDYIVISDVIAARKSHNTVSGGADKDIIVIGSTENPVVIQYATGDGDDVVYGYSSNDTIQITKGDYVTAASGQDIIITVGTGKITLVGAQGQKLNILKEAVKVEGITEKNGTLTLSKTFRGKTLDLADYAASVTKVNASALTAEYPVNVTGNSAGNSIKGGKGGDTISGETGDDTLYGGAGNDSIFGGAGKDKLYGEAGNDTLYAGAGNNTLTGGAGKDVFVYEGGSDVIADYKAGDDKIKLANASITSSSLSGSNIVLKTSAGNITVKGGKDKNITVIDKNNSETTQIYGRMNYNANQTAVTLASTFTGTLNTSEYASTVKRIDASSTSKAIRIYGNAQANTILGGNGGDTVYGAAGNDSILGNKGKDKLFGDAGNDILIGGLGNDTLTGGAGNDVFVYSNGDGADVIADFTAGTDKISLASGSVSSASLKSSDMVFKIGSGSLTVKNGKDKEISIDSAIYYNNLIYDSKKTTVTLGSSFSGSLKASDYDSKTKTINAASVAKAVNITGNSQANSILGGKGADTLSGGTGSDTLTGGAGKDVFVYANGDGKDVITDYTAGQDKVKITSGSISKTSYTGNDVVFTIGSGTLTIQNGKGKKITITDSNNKTTTQTYSGAVSGRSALWFADDNNFITSAPALDSILQVNSIEYSTEYTPSTMDFSTQPRDSVSAVSYAQHETTR